jgi:hypothetical protein
MRKYLDKFGLKERGDFSILTIFIVAIGPGSLVLLSWLLKLFGILFLSDIIDAIFGGGFILFLYLLVSTILAIFWWGFILIDQFGSKKD